jgi:2,4-dienoyl-CoA reductase-like NADH-dependent reductase (Old Yellow Enzyme family)
MSTSQLFTPITLRGVTLRNRVVVSPMCQYAATDGMANDYHLAHLGRFAMGGAGLVFVEATAVSRRGRITHGDVGLWKDRQVESLARIAQFLKQQGAAAGIQLGHAGRKASMQRPWFGNGPLDMKDRERGDDPWTVIGPSAIPVAPNWLMPRAMTRADIERVKRDFANAARRALAAGFDVLELHSAHGYLLHQFLSPLSNHRTDDYGNSPERRMRLVVDIASDVRAIWPEDRPLFVRLSAVDNIDGGLTIDDTVELAGKLASIGVDVIDCSSGGMLGPATDRRVSGFGFQVPYAEEVRRRTDVRTMAVGLIVNPQHAESIVATGRADLVAIGRAALHDPNWPFHARVALTADTESSPRETLPRQHAWWLSRHAAAIRQLPPWQEEATQT